MEAVRRDQPDLALEAWSGDLGDIKRWLSSGLVDAALVPEPLTAPDLASHRIGEDRLVQVSSVRRAVQAWDPAYIYVDLGPEFRSPVSGDMPVLFISGTLDARTPPSNAEEVRAGFANSEHMIIENGTHDDDLFLPSPLILQGILEFLHGEPVSEPRIRLEAGGSYCR